MKHHGGIGMKKMMMALLAGLALLWGAAAMADEGEPATDFTLKAANGKNIKLSELRGTVVMLNFWASWCGPCRTEMPLLDDLYQQYRDYGFTVLGVNLDESRDQADRLLEKIPVTFPVLFDPQNQTSEAYGVDAMPTTVLIDRNGVIRHHHRGYKDGYMEQYENQVKTLVLE